VEEVPLAESEAIVDVKSGRKPISPPRVKSADLLRPVVVRSRSVGSPSAALNRTPIAFSFSAIFVSSAGPASRRRTQDLSRLSLRVAKGKVVVTLAGSPPARVAHFPFVQPTGSQ
jgi:hypothetical protein